MQRFILDCCRSDWNFNRSNATSGIVGTYDCIKAFSETDLTEDLKKTGAPTLIIQDDVGQIIPYEDAALFHAKTGSRRRENPKHFGGFLFYDVVYCT